MCLMWELNIHDQWVRRGRILFKRPPTTSSYSNAHLSFPVCQGHVLIRKDLIIPKQKPAGDTKGRSLCWLLILFYQTARREEVVCLSCQALLFFGRRGPGDKRPPCYLCVKGHIGLAEEAKATTICVFHTLWCSYLDHQGPGWAITHMHTGITSLTYIYARGPYDEGCIVRRSWKTPRYVLPVVMCA